MLNIKAFRPMVHEKKIFEYLSIFSLIWPQKGPVPSNQGAGPLGGHLRGKKWEKF